MSAAPTSPPGRPDLTDEQRAGLEAARALARAGVPIFVAPPVSSDPTGYGLPKRWQDTRPGEHSLGAVDRWRPGWALCAVMGHVVDLLDVDPRNGGSASIQELAAGGAWPSELLATAATPSGGWHAFVPAMGVGSRDGVRPGFDVKGGRADGTGRGFAFLAPTERPSKVDGVVSAYRWVQPPDADRVGAAARAEDRSDVAPLAAVVRAALDRTPSSSSVDGAAGTGELAHGAPGDPIPDGERHAALVSYAGRLRNRGLTYAEAEALYLLRFADCAQPPAARYPVTREEALDKLRDVFDRYPAGEERAELTMLEVPGAPGVLAVGPAVAAEPVDPLEDAVRKRMAQLEVEERARSRRASAARPAMPAPISLSNALQIEWPDAKWLVDGLLPSEGIVLLSAPQKAGKTTAVGNLVRSLADGGRFLDAFAVDRPLRVTLLDTESGERRLYEWLGAQGVRNAEQVVTVSLRGQEAALDPRDRACRAEWASTLIGSDVVILDVVGPVLAALGLDESDNAHVGQFFTAWRTLLLEAGVPAGVLVHHAGHDQSRAIGASSWLRYPDAVWKLEREDNEEPHSPRYFSAHGRDVEVFPGRLDFDPATRGLTYSGQSKTQARVARTVEQLAGLLREAGPQNFTACKSLLMDSGVPRDPARAAPAEGVRSGVLTSWQEGRSVLYGVAGLHFGPSSTGRSSGFPTLEASA